MYKKIATYCLIVGVFFIIDNLRAEVIVNHMMTRDPNRDTGCEPPIPNYTFFTIDSEAYCWIDIDDVIEGDVVTYEWYGPNSALYFDDTLTMGFTGNGCAWHSIYIRNADAADMPGDWHVDVFYNDTFQFTENFTIEGGLCPARQIYGDNSEKTQLLRYFRDSVLSKTPEGQEIIKLYYQWSPVIVKTMEEDEEFKEDVKELIDGILLLIEEVLD